MADFVKLSGKDGKSAYEIWLEQGNSGTEQDFLDSLKGEKGEKGDRGLPGAHGIQGETGAKGEDGADGKDGTSVTITKVTEINVDGGSNVVTFSDGKTLTVKNGSKGSTGAKGEDGQDYVLTENDKTEIANEALSILQGGEIPEYWNGAFTEKDGKTYTKYLDEKIARVKALQNEGGKDSFSFIVMTDMHYQSLLAYNTPLLAKKILDNCDIKFALCLGDVQTRGCHETKELLLAENEKIEKMLSPIRDRLLQTQGNHDGNYGILNGTKYVYRITPQELYGAIYRKVGLVGDVYFDKSGCGYYIDDTSNKVRYVLLNTHNTAYELNDDGTQVYPNMSIFRFGQSQYDLVVDALNTIPSNDWAIVFAGHIALGINGGHSPWGDGTESNADCTLMNNLLSAYKQGDESFEGEFKGTAGGTETSANFTNLFDVTENGYVSDSYFASATEIKADNKSFITNYIPITANKTTPNILRIAGVANCTGLTVICYDSNFNALTANGTLIDCLNGDVSGAFKFDENDIMSWKGGAANANDYISSTNYGSLAYVRFCVRGGISEDDIIITVNQEISFSESEGGKGYDYVYVSTDFIDKEKRGKIVGFFGGHTHRDLNNVNNSINRITTRCDAHEENVDANNGSTEDEELYNERIKGTIAEQSFDVFTINKAKRKIYATKIGAGIDREIDY